MNDLFKNVASHTNKVSEAQDDIFTEKVKKVDTPVINDEAEVKSTPALDALLTNAEPAETTFVKLEAGRYTCNVLELEQRATKKDNNLMLVMKYQISEGETKGQIISEFFVLENKTNPQFAEANVSKLLFRLTQSLSIPRSWTNLSELLNAVNGNQNLKMVPVNVDIIYTAKNPDFPTIEKVELA